jgi:hypothetical protein
LKALLSVALLVAVVADASAEERKRLEMPQGLRNPGETALIDPTMPPGLARMFEPVPGDAKLIVSDGRAAVSRQPAVDFYNNLTRSTWTQIRDGREPTLPSGELKGENRWALPPSVGVVVERPLFASDANGSAPASFGFNAGPGVQRDGTTGGVAVNARVRMPFGR